MVLIHYEVTQARFVNGTCQNARKCRESMRLGLRAPVLKNRLPYTETYRILCTFSSRPTISIIPRSISLTAQFSTIPRISHGYFINIHVVANHTCLPSH